MKTIVKRCIMCRTKHTLEVSTAGYRQWQEGVLIQRAMPMLTDDQRELLISGICGSCFDKTFEEED